MDNTQFNELTKIEDYFTALEYCYKEDEYLRAFELIKEAGNYYNLFSP
jgi:hypothetical protein